jgi:DNA polymerase III epsilon subunit-like protein
MAIRETIKQVLREQLDQNNMKRIAYIHKLLKKYQDEGVIDRYFVGHNKAINVSFAAAKFNDKLLDNKGYDESLKELVDYVNETREKILKVVKAVFGGRSAFYIYSNYLGHHDDRAERYNRQAHSVLNGKERFECFLDNNPPTP